MFYDIIKTMSKQWVLREQISPDLVRQILFYREIKKDEEIEKFINPDYERDLHDPFLMKDMDKAVERILQAIKNNEKVVIFGDYDADGVCASAIFHDFFKKIGFENFHIHIPDRNLEGYGLTKEAIREFAENKFNLIVTLDCGITNVEEVGKANKNNIDVVIIDHHLAPEKLPDAFAIVDSKQKNDRYPFKDLCGAGVAFKTIQALIAKGGFNIIPGWEKWLLDLVAIATIADMVPMIGENRILTFYGLKVLEKTQRQGLLAFFRRLEISPKNISEDDISFMIAPRINIASRMGHANTSFNLLTTESSGEANWIAGHLEGMNIERRALVDDLLGQISEKISEKKPEIIIEGDYSWNPGVLGLMANRLVEKYNCPVFLWGKGEAKMIKGSARSDGSVNLVEMMKTAPEGILLEFGGHVMAGGFSIKEEKIDDFKKEIVKIFKKIGKQKTDNDILYIDKEISINDANWETCDILEKMRPFGISNPKPVFLFSDLEIAGSRKFGNGGLHLQLDFKKSGGEKISAIGFFFNGNGNSLRLETGKKIDLVASMEKSFFRFAPELRLRIIDVKIR